jgi:hypothetical protein
MGTRQFLAFRFGSDSRFEGQLVGALERIESGGAIRVLDGLFVSREPGSGELSAISLGGGTSSRSTSRLLGFRLDASERRAATRRALAGLDGETVQSVADKLAPGAAIAAVLIEHTWAEALTDAVDRIGGTEIASEFADVDGVSAFTARLLEAAQQQV